MHIGVTHIEAGHIQSWWLEQHADAELIVPPEARVFVPVSVLHLHGRLDGSSYTALVEAVREEVAQGTRHLILDFAEVEALSSAGLVGLYESGCTLAGRALDGLDGHGLMAEMRRSIDKGERFADLCLAAPAPGVSEVLDATHFALLARIMPSVDDALATLARENYPSG